MTDQEVFEKFMLWMGMKLFQNIKVNGNSVITYIDTEECDKHFTKVGYDEFYAGLNDGDRQPTEAVIHQWLEDEYPHLNSTQRRSAYQSTRRTIGSEKVKDPQ